MKGKFQTEGKMYNWFSKRKEMYHCITKNRTNDKLDRLEKNGCFYLKLTITIGLHQRYIERKKSKEIHFCMDFSTGLNDALKKLSLPTSKARRGFLHNFVVVRYFSKINLCDMYMQTEVGQQMFPNYLR